MLTDWISKEYLDPTRIARLQKEFRKAKPYSHLVLPNFFKVEKAVVVLKALSKEQFIFKEADLFKIKQTNDLRGTSVQELKQARDFLYSKEFVDYMRVLTGFKLLQKPVDLAGTLYEDTDYLLCHDDQLDDRKIAFLGYLSSMKPKDGGGLELFGNLKGKPGKVMKTIVPQFNTLAFFEVSPISYHQVSEVVVKKQRIALGGWYYD